MPLLSNFEYPLGVAGRGIPDPTIRPVRALYSPNATFEPRFFLDLPGQPEPQGQIGSCTAHGTSVVWEAFAWHMHRVKVDLSRSFLYWIGREPRGWTQEDAGAIPEDVYRQITEIGVCPEFVFPYTLDYRQAPPAECFEVAGRNRSTEWLRPHSIEEIKQAMKEGHGTTFAFIVFGNSIDSARETGRWARPDSTSYYGAHQVAAVGWDDEIVCPGYEPGAFLIANSWKHWGIDHPTQGWDSFFWMPYEAMFDPDIVFSPAIIVGIPNVGSEEPQF